MWSQAARLTKLSNKKSLAVYGNVAYGGDISLGRERIGWTVWKAEGRHWTVDGAMRAHTSSDSFKQARIRIATLDKAHYSLLEDAGFTRELSCIVVDEAHSYDGMFGANVHFFLKRVFVAREVCSRPKVVVE
jgi:ATP-dependent helicase YprA (DUF1998 family)